MANLPSAKKSIKQDARKRVRNRARRSAVKTETKKFLEAIHLGNLQEAQELLVRVTKKIDQVASKGTLHRNTAARNKSQLARRLNAALAAKSG